MRNARARFVARSKGLALSVLFSAFSLPSAGLPATPDEPRQISESGREDARAELELGAKAYRERDFARARRHFERSRDLDPSQPAVRLLVARAIHAQYRAAGDSAEKTSKAREAVAAYREALTGDPGNEEAYQAVFSLYGAMGEREQQRDWVLRRAGDASVPAKKRAEAYMLLAGQEERCARSAAEGSSEVPATENARQAAYRCATRALESLESALALDPESEPAWAAKIRLLSTLAKLAGMDGKSEEKVRYEKLAAEAQSRAKEVSEKNRQKSEARSY